MRIVFMGSGDLACPSLEALAASGKDEVVTVVTQPDRPKGRRRHVASCPVKAFAEAKGLPVMTPEKVGSPAAVKEMTKLAPDLIAVAAYGQYIPSSILKIPASGAINVHPSLLPKYRGAAPVQWAIANGENETGVTIMFVAKEMDAGDIILQEAMGIGPDDTAASLGPRLAKLGADLLVRAVDLFRAGEVARKAQDGSQATLAPKLKKEDGRIDWTLEAKAIRNRIRGFQPWPGCFCEAPQESGHFLRVFAARVEAGGGAPGEVLEAIGDGPLIAAGNKALRLLEVQPEGKKHMTGKDYLNGHAVFAGEVWG
jgi:methionyl-tRNA formyltransferase